MLKYLTKDAERYFELDRISLPNKKLSFIEKFRIICVSYGLHVIICYRFICFVDYFWAKNILLKCLFLPLKIISIFCGYISIILYGSLINREASIGPGFYIGHVGGIVIGPTTIGENFTITHNVTIGTGKTITGRGMPVIKDNVWIATGAIVYGKIKIGNGATISPGAVVAKDIEARCLVAGNPARIISRDYDNKALLHGIDATK